MPQVLSIRLPSCTGASFRNVYRQVHLCTSASSLHASSFSPLLLSHLNCFDSNCFDFWLLVIAFTNIIISFIASVANLISASICLMWAWVRLLMSSSVISACSSMRLALNCFAEILVCLSYFVYLFEMKKLMFGQVLLAVALFSHSQTAGLYSPVTLR